MVIGIDIQMSKENTPAKWTAVENIKSNGCVVDCWLKTKENAKNESNIVKTQFLSKNVKSTNKIKKHGNVLYLLYKKDWNPR